MKSANGLHAAFFAAWASVEVDACGLEEQFLPVGLWRRWWGDFGKESTNPGKVSTST